MDDTERCNFRSFPVCSLFIASQAISNRLAHIVKMEARVNYVQHMWHLLHTICYMLEAKGQLSYQFGQSWNRIDFLLPHDIHISAYVIFGSFLIGDSTLETFSGVTVVAIRPLRLSSSSTLAPDMNGLNHPKTVALGGDWSPKRCFKLWKHSCKDFPWH